MEKVSISLPEQFLYETTMEVRTNDVNYAGHLGNVQIIGLLDEARVRLFKWLGYKESDVEGTSSIMGDMTCQFQGEAFWGDELVVKMSIGDFFEKAYRVFFQLSHKKNGKPVAIAMCTLVTFDYKSRKVKRVPESFKERIERLISEK